MKTLPLFCVLRSLRSLLPLLLLCTLAPAATLHAQLSKIFVASFGNDANDGSRGAPKRNFQAAHNAVAAGGQIVVLDTAGYGTLNITKSLDVTVPPGVNGFVTVALGTPRAITVNAGSSGIVSLRGLIVEGGANSTTQTPNTNYGILVTSCDVMSVEDCTIRNFYDGLIAVTPVSLFIARTEVRNCRYGLDTEGANEALVTDCTFFSNGDAIYAASDSNGFVTAVMEVARTTFQQNNTAVRTVGISFVNLGNCTFGVKGQGLNTSATTTGGIYTYGNNQGTTTTFTGTVSTH